jgi:predicted permease
MTMTGLVLLIACANVAGLLIARAATRQREFAVRLAIGAGRMQVVTQLMLESLLLSAIAAGAGLGLGLLINRGLLQFINADNLPMTITAALDRRVLVFLMGVAFLTTFIFGLVPALQATRPRLAETLKSEAGSIFGSCGHARIRKFLVIAQLSLSLLLLIASSLFVRSLSNLYQVDPGFRKDQLISFMIDPAINGYNSERTQQFYRDVLERLRSLPGVLSAGQAVQRILDGAERRNSITVEGYTPPPDDLMFTHFNAVSSGYFMTLGIPLISGRDFDARDTTNLDADNPLRSCIVNEAFARKYFSDGQALGRHIGMGNRLGTQTTIEIVGVVRNSSYDKLRGEIPAQMFIPIVLGPPATVVYLRTTGAPAALFQAVRSTVHDMDPNLPLFGMRTIEEQIDRSLVTERMIATLSSAFGTVATVLALIGLYGVMAFTVASRTKEIGIRVSLGAQQSNVLGMMMREVAIVMLAGIAIAIPAYIGLSRFIRSQLYGVQSNDPFYIASATLFLLAIGLIAGYIPCRRALRMDPIHVLRYE